MNHISNREVALRWTTGMSCKRQVVPKLFTVTSPQPRLHPPHRELWEGAPGGLGWTWMGQRGRSWGCSRGCSQGSSLGVGLGAEAVAGLRSGAKAGDGIVPRDRARVGLGGAAFLPPGGAGPGLAMPTWMFLLAPLGGHTPQFGNLCNRLCSVNLICRLFLKTLNINTSVWLGV